MRISILAGMIGAAALVGGVGFYCAPRATKAAEPVQRSEVNHQEALQAQIEAVTAEVQRLKQMQPQVSTQQRAVPTSSPSSAEASATRVDPSSTLDPEQQQRLVEEQTQKRFALLARGIETEASDPEWSQSAQQSLLGAYQGGEFDGAKFDVTCRTTFCRLKADLSGAGQPMVAARMLSLRSPWPAPSLFKIDTVKNQVEYYVAREDYELPREN